MGSAWIGTEQVSNQLQAIVDSNRLAERDRTAADILDLSEVGSFSITLKDEMSITRMGDHRGESRSDAVSDMRYRCACRLALV